jgi:hypothetical protein
MPVDDNRGGSHDRIFADDRLTEHARPICPEGTKYETAAGRRKRGSSMSARTETEIGALEARLREETDRKISSIREEIKEREPSVIGAIRTLTTDLLAWHRKERPDFPRSATIGLAFACMRRRVVLALGGIFALVVAAAQIWLIKGQNEILEEQARLSKAAILGSILKELRENDPLSTSNSAVLSTFSDVVFDQVAEIATSPTSEFHYAVFLSDSDDRIWMNSVQIVRNQFNRLSRDQARVLRNSLLGKFITVKDRIYQIRILPQEQTDDFDPWDDERSLYRLSNVLEELFLEMSSKYPPIPQDYVGQSKLLANKIATYFIEYDGDTYETDLDRSITELCSAMSGIPASSVRLAIAERLPDPNTGGSTLRHELAITELCGDKPYWPPGVVKWVSK